MIRKRFVFDSPAVLPYNIRLEVSIASQIKESRQISGKTWVDWVHDALDRLEIEPSSELESLFVQAQLVSGSRKDKVSLPFRVCSSDIDRVRVTASTYNASLQSVLVAAMYLYSIVTLAEQLVSKDG